MQIDSSENLHKTDLDRNRSIHGTSLLSGGKHNIHRFLKNNQKGARGRNRFGCAARLSQQLPLIIFHCPQEKQMMMMKSEVLCSSVNTLSSLLSTFASMAVGVTHIRHRNLSLTFDGSRTNILTYLVKPSLTINPIGAGWNIFANFLKIRRNSYHQPKYLQRWPNDFFYSYPI